MSPQHRVREGGPRPRVAVPESEDHPSYYVVRDFVANLEELGVERWDIGFQPTAARVLAKTRLPAIIRSWPRRPILVPLMGARLPFLYWASLHGTPVPFCWDVWQPQWKIWTSCLQNLKPRLVFATAGESAEFLDAVLSETRVAHVPEATKTNVYKPASPLVRRRIKLLELGRRHEKWHEAITKQLLEANFEHVYQRGGKRLIFSTEASLHNGLADTAVLACFPSSDTHPNRSGRVETLTHRYLEGMASGCLLIGKAPGELIDLMGFNPVVEVDWERPAQQILELLTDIQKWQPHVNRTLNRVVEVGDWSLRATQTLSILKEEFGERGGR
jgi:hypothetical protein